LPRSDFPRAFNFNAAPTVLAPCGPHIQTGRTAPDPSRRLDLQFFTTVGLQDPLTATLGLPICAQAIPWAEVASSLAKAREANDFF